MRRANIITAALLLISSIYIIWEATRMEYMVDNVPGPGFLPLWCGVLLCFLAVLLLLTNIKKSTYNAAPMFNKKIYKNMGAVIGASSIAMFLVKFLGMLVCIGLLTGVLCWAFGNKNLKTCVMITIFLPLGFWLLFIKALGVILPQGLLGF
ncbi:tripartite tricarboxylate transporter TctB family protein [Candidatus Formimonas warabiya]|uniref:DUF1468 domain-containing protein n=1 Tax=Formimonas warabiya TaxID=1761012 RepID=A0A3G1KY50_FORW1|nr:tripartite tricarboxylate transporter TctB family protein [Candidatus Formimonas warabiya]ATW27414.1 hypothetical protein DCMF_24040 [Candidatus Formimonas warabiya]